MRDRKFFTTFNREYRVIRKSLNREWTLELLKGIGEPNFDHAVSVRIKIRFFFRHPFKLLSDIHSYTITVHSMNVDVSLIQLLLKGLSSTKRKFGCHSTSNWFVSETSFTQQYSAGDTQIVVDCSEYHRRTVVQVTTVTLTRLWVTTMAKNEILIHPKISNLRRKQEIMSNSNKNFRTNYSHKIRIIQL